nr:sodium- and chloride-dependent glycine transporter 2 [Onthophagus taurus]XP_022903757.1 sodium- and chloride-dependent glycine transporter 2 [Onthophagus taurus]
MSNLEAFEADLIDFAGSPPNISSPINENISNLEDDLTTDNLIDSDVTILEKKLQNSINNPVNKTFIDTIDVEDILIDLDDDEDDVNEAGDLNNFVQDSEVLSVLEQLDKVINDSLEDCDVVIEEEELVRIYLEELDSYLKNIETNCSFIDYEEEGCKENLERNLQEISLCSNSSNSSITSPSCCANLLRKSSSFRFSSSESTRNEAFRRSHPYRSTVSSISTSLPPLKIEKNQQNIPQTASSHHQTHEIQSDNTENQTENDEQVQKLHSTPEPHWLRSSMRRLRHLRLPSDTGNTPTISVSNENTTNEVENVEIVENRPIETRNQRPTSAPSVLIGAEERSPASSETGNEVPPGNRTRINSSSSRNRRHTSPSSSESSVATTVDSTPSCTPIPSPIRVGATDEGGGTNSRRLCERVRSELPDVESPLGHWPHSLSSMLACLSCSLGLFNICRFAILSIHFGANFIFQFFILSMVIGLPMFTLQLCLGQQLGAGVIDMWRISPLFQGVGVSLLVSQALIGLYSITGVSWMFVYFRDSFITKMDKYRWAEPFMQYRKDQPLNTSFKLSDTIPDYLSGVVYQRTNLVYGNVYGTIKFQPAFNLAVVWMIVFVSLSKGLRSYGKVVFVFTLLPVFAMFIFCAKLLGMMPPEYIHIVFPETSWGEFFLNSKSWVAAGQETFLTWGLLSAAVMQLASHNKNKHLLQRDSSLIAVLTFSILILVAFLANTCVQILHSYGYVYQPNSFEKMSSYGFLRPLRDNLPGNSGSTPLRYMGHNSYILGEKVLKPGMDTTTESGYQVLRFATELIPATFALLGSEKISPFWAVLFYFILILFGIAQQLAIWHCVITGIMAIKAKVLKSWETTITFFSCTCGFVLGLPMTTELGVYVVYFLDVTIGGLWWLILVILLQIIAVFMVRGRPYSGDTVVTALFKHSSPSCVYSWAPALLSFVWNVILPVVLMIFCVAFFKNGNFRELFIWHHAPTDEYWPLWARQIGSIIQLLPVLCIPIIAVIQSYRYLNNGPPDILDRIQYLYRPPLGEHMDSLAIQEIASTILATSVVVPEVVRSEDPPPKYTPPPSYTTATGARIAKFLRQSIRRSVRRIANALGEGSSRQTSSNIPESSSTVVVVPPPDYNAVLVEMNNQTGSENVNQVSVYVTNASNTTTDGLTAAQVANILRGSFRRNETGTASLSAENLVDSAVPIGESSLVTDDKTICDTVI